ncbi:hypothetical protein FBU30_007131 [Linnemannia zychae]|nr:hypothetical protein FBU30_007131 [Linnemannia zychae]
MADSKIAPPPPPPLSSSQSQTTPTATATPTSGDINETNMNTPNGNTYSSFETGGFIYIVLTGAMLIAIFYFGRAFLAKRRERVRRLKDPDFEANPPTYTSHSRDLQVIDASHLHHHHQEQQQQYQQGSGVHRSRSTSSSNISVINAPTAALIRGNGNGADGEVVSYYLITPRVLHEHQRQQIMRHARSSSSPAVGAFFSQGSRRTRTRTEVQSAPVPPRCQESMVLNIPSIASEPLPPAYEDLSPCEEQHLISEADATSLNHDRMGNANRPPRIDSLPGAGAMGISTSLPSS